MFSYFNKIKLSIPIFYHGFFSLIYQIIIIREIFSISGGLEIYAGIIFALWLLFYSLGLFVGNRLNINNSIIISIIYILPIILTLIIYINLPEIKNFISPYGQIQNFIKNILINILCVSPICFLFGIFFSLWNNHLKSVIGQDKTIELYISDVLEAIIGGITFYFLLNENVNHYNILYLSSFLAIPSIFFIIRKILICLIFSLITTILLVIPNFKISYKDLIQKYYPQQNLIKFYDTRYGKLHVLKHNEQVNFYYNYEYSFSDFTTSFDETIVHLPLLIKDTTNNVLLIGQYNPHVIKELLKYQIKKLYIISQDQIFHETTKHLFPFLDTAKTNIIILPELTQINNKTKFDVIICNLSKPSNFLNNRYYTIEFYKYCSQILNNKGILITSLPITGEYANDYIRNVYSITYNTLKFIWKYVDIYVFDYLFFIASQKHIAKFHFDMLKNKNITTSWLNEFYVDTISINHKTIQYKKLLDLGKSKINSIKEPINVLHYQTFYLTITNDNSYFYIFLIILTIISLFIITKLKKSLLLCFFSGLTSINIQFILILIFQLCFGNLYYSIALFYIIFMLGSIIGFITVQQNKKKNINYLLLYWVILSSSTILTLIILYFADLNKSIYSLFFFTFFLANFLSSFSSSAIVATLIREQTEKSQLSGNLIYAADMIGAFVGTFAFSLFFLPFLGMSFSLFTLIIINFILFALIITKKINH